MINPTKLTKSRLPLLIAALTILLLALAACASPGLPVDQSAEQPAQGAASGDDGVVENKPAAGGLEDNAQRIKGSPDAPITIVEYSDYQCPFCSRWFEQTYPSLLQEYVDAGKVHIVIRDFPL